MCALIARLTTWTEGSELSHTNLNAEFDNIHDEINGALNNANLSASAAIVDTKLATISTSGKVADTALSESASGLLRSQTGINTTAGKVWKWNGIAATLADPGDATLYDYFLSVSTGTSGEGRFQGAVTTSGMNVGPKYLGASGVLVDNIDGLSSGDWIVFIGFAVSATKLIVLNPSGRAFGRKR